MKRDAGNATVELAVSLPALVLLLLVTAMSLMLRLTVRRIR